MSQTFNKELPENCACVPYGSIEPATKYRKHSKKAVRLKTLPVLAGYFSSAKLKLDTNAPHHIGLGSLDTNGELPILAIRLQLGANMLYWLANPADPEIWATVDAWHKAGQMAVAAEFDDGRLLLVQRDFKRAPQLRALESAAGTTSRHSATREFMQSAGEALVSGELARRATTDIPGVPCLQSVQGCTVRTKTTGRILVPLDVACTSSCDLLIPESLACQLPSNQAVH
jgi:hypothetical protein